jgi:hypothetical protein
LVFEQTKTCFLQSTPFLAKHSLQREHKTGNAPDKQEIITSDVFSRTERSADIRPLQLVHINATLSL